MNLVGQELGQYRIVEKVGQGRLATVYRAYQRSLDRWVALKVLETAQVSNAAFLMRFHREARQRVKLRHPHILSVYHHEVRDGYAFLIMDYADGGSLGSRLAGQPMPWHAAAALALPVARALAYAHSQGVTHCNLKPHNILLARGDWPLLSDFGMGRLEHTGRMASVASEPVDALAYRSPEQAQAIECDRRSDIYSLGVVLYQMVTGRRPFDAATSLEIVQQHVSRMPEPPTQHNPELPAMAEALILRALAKNPGARYQSMEEMVNALQVALTQTSAGTRDPTYTPMVARHITCLRCGAVVNLLGRYCPKCGATLRSTDLLRPAAAEGEGSKTPEATGPRFVLENGSQIVFPPKAELAIGRADALNEEYPDIDLGPQHGAARGVSRLHARLYHRGDAWVIQDAGSTNGTFLNGRRVAGGEETLLREGDRIRCGQLSMTYRAK